MQVELEQPCPCLGTIYSLCSVYYPNIRQRSDVLKRWNFLETGFYEGIQLRKEKRARTLTQTGLEDWAETPERSAASSELGDELQEGIAQLQLDLRAAVVLRDVEELSNVEAAEVLGITVSSVKSRLHRGSVLLRKYLSDYVKVAE